MCNVADTWQSYLCVNPFKIFIMTLLNIIIVLVVVGLVLWLINNYIPMDRKIKSILNVVVLIAVVLWLLQAFGLLNALNVKI